MGRLGLSREAEEPERLGLVSQSLVLSGPPVLYIL